MTKNSYCTPVVLVFAGLVAFGGLCGCQTHMGGQTLPSAYYLRDDVQYFPAGPETQLPNKRRAIEEYKASQEVLADDLQAIQ
ncbi:MAG: hypothetical protein KDA80_21500 [Planctomycetaceae bacterium]|nr:hypothetical protein [Planctomycetaceae bacterium]